MGRRLAPLIVLACAIVAACTVDDEPTSGPGVDAGACCSKTPSTPPAPEKVTGVDAATCEPADCADASPVDASCTGACTDASSADATTCTSAECADASADASSVDAGADSAIALAPALGAHALAYYRLEVRPSPLSTPALATAMGGTSTIIASVGRGDIGAFSTMAPFDNKNAGSYPQLGTAHAYTQWPTSGTALYGLTAAAGGAGHVVSTATPSGDELTLAAVEVVNGTVVQDFKWNEVLVGNPVTSLAVNTTGPATLIAFWWGDANADGNKTATPNNGFVVIDSILEAGALVQCAVAVKSVPAAGTYDVTWAATPAQGAQLWLVAVQ